MASQDIRENNMPQGVAAYLRGVASNGDSILVTIASVIQNCFYNRGLTSSIDKFDFNNAQSGVYTVNEADCLNQPHPAIGTLVSFIGTYKLQIFMCIADGSNMFIRVSDVNNDWRSWRKIQSVSI